MAKVKITQVRSVIGHPENQRASLRTLGIRRINHSVERELTPQTEGLIKKVKHLVRIENI
ncbi:MAG: 50S ribosomal protein L30 [Bacteroidales bacterium]|nr:50S ribosomal protein L30 [Bacteroidales bacterium]